MIKALHFVALCLLLVGCAHDDAGLVVKELRLDEDSIPLPFVVAIQNDTGSAAKIQGVSVNVLNQTLISRSQDADRIPDGFDYEVRFSDDHPTEIPANSDGNACGFLVWKLPPDPPPMIAVAMCEFQARVNGETLTTQPITLVLQSREGIVTEDAADSPLAAEQAKKTLAVLERTAGEKSTGFNKLMRQLRANAAD